MRKSDLEAEVAEASSKVKSIRFASADRRHSSVNGNVRVCGARISSVSVDVGPARPKKARGEARRESEEDPLAARKTGVRVRACGIRMAARRAHACMRACARFTGGGSAPFGDRCIATAFDGVRRRARRVHVHACTHR